MRKALFGLLTVLAILLLLCTGIFANLIKFFCWLFLLQYSAPETSIVGGIIVRLLSFAVAYGLVYIIFNLFGFFNSKLMSVSYFVFSTILGFIFAYLVWAIETYILIIGIIFGVLIMGIIAFIIIKIIKNHNNKLTK